MENQLAIENMISLYDELLIPAEESVHQMKKAYKGGMKQIKELKKKIESANGDTMIMEDCYEEGIMILQDIKSDIKSYKVSKGDKFLDFVVNILPIIAYITACFGLDHVFNKYFMLSMDLWTRLREICARMIAEELAGKAASKVTKVATKPLQGRLMTKNVLLKGLDSEINAMKKSLAEIRGMDEI